MSISIIFEVLVMGLMGVTIAYCYILNTRLQRMRSNEGELREVVAQLFQASKKAEAAVKALTEEAQVTETRLSEEVDRGEGTIIELNRQMSDAKILVTRIQKVVRTAKASGMSNDEMLQRQQPQKTRAPAPRQQRQQAQAYQNPVAQPPQIPEPTPLQADTGPANQNRNAVANGAQFGRRAEVEQGQSNADALQRLERNIKSLKAQKKGRAA